MHRETDIAPARRVPIYIERIRYTNMCSHAGEILSEGFLYGANIENALLLTHIS